MMQKKLQLINGIKKMKINNMKGLNVIKYHINKIKHLNEYVFYLMIIDGGKVKTKKKVLFFFSFSNKNK